MLELNPNQSQNALIAASEAGIVKNLRTLLNGKDLYDNGGCNCYTLKRPTTDELLKMGVSYDPWSTSLRD